MFLRYDEMCVTLLAELDDGRYVNVFKLNETTIGRYVFIPVTGRDDDRYVTFLQLHETTIGSIQKNDRTSFHTISAK